MIAELGNALAVEFPLRGEDWIAITSPADRIPSHGTDILGERYAYDFIRVDQRRGLYYHGASWPRVLLLGVPTHECYAWGASVHAPVDGQVARVQDGVSERTRVFPLREAARAIWNGLTFRVSRAPAIMGNYVIIRFGDVFAAFAHLAPGSITVSEGQPVRAGDVIGRVGHTGNSTSPHLHFQLMDAADPLVARGVPCVFRSYEVRSGDGWRDLRNGVPGRADRLRFLDPAR